MVDEQGGTFDGHLAPLLGAGRCTVAASIGVGLRPTGDGAGPPGACQSRDSGSGSGGVSTGTRRRRDAATMDQTARPRLAATDRPPTPIASMVKSRRLSPNNLSPSSSSSSVPLPSLRGGAALGFAFAGRGGALGD